MKDENGNPITGKLHELELENKKLATSIAELEKKADEKLDEHRVAHAKAIRIDLGELGLQFGVVLCSLAILMKGRGLWFLGLISSALGLAVALTGQFALFLGHH
jgi:uncharacterized membrane protein YcjF (UPF0283 family)